MRGDRKRGQENMAQQKSKKALRAERTRKKARGKVTRWLVRLAILAVLAAGVGWYYFTQSNLPGQGIEGMGRAHVSQSSPVSRYNSSPATSGPHANPARWGEQLTEISELNQVHNLEHGGILIQYNCRQLPAGSSCGEIQAVLSAVFRKARREIDRKIILAPYGKMPRLIALTAWRRLQYFDEVNETGILRFVKLFINSGPERGP